LLPFSSEPSVFPSALKKVKIKTHKIIILPVVLYGYVTWSLTLREEHRLNAFEKIMLRKIFEPKGVKWQEAGENRIMMRFINFTLRQI
jgi:hypothetical protein